MSRTAAVHGVDIDRDAIEWAATHLPFASVPANQPSPPLPHPDGSFDLVYSLSVFTHIDATLQDQWLEELRRVTRPGGFLVLSIHGEHVFAEFADQARAAGADPDFLRQQLVRDGIAFHRDNMWTDGPFPDFHHTTFHAPLNVFGHWSRYFTVRALVAHGSLGYQDFVLLERTPNLPRQVPLSRRVDPLAAPVDRPPTGPYGRRSSALRHRSNRDPTFCRPPPTDDSAWPSVAACCASCATTQSMTGALRRSCSTCFFTSTSACHVSRRSYVTVTPGHAGEPRIPGPQRR